MKRFLLISFILLVAASMIFASGGSQSQGSVPIQNASTITVEVFDRGTDGGRSDPTNNNWTDWIKQKVLKDENINVSFVSIPRSQEEQGIINKMAAGDAPDIIFTYNAILVNNFALQGGLFEMTPYVDSLMPDLRSFLGPDPSVPGRDFIYRMTDSSTGKLYAVPATRMPIPLGLGEMGSFIRKDWLDKLGLPEPTTTQQFYDTMVAFRDKDPGNVGKGVVIPYAMRTYDMMLGAFLDPNLSDKDRWIEGDYVQPGYKE
ncbi:MAG: extracellular solute-binding protein, partial [Treponema sp.]|nr:extracellular solute-binding protein [Treponema sp.]